jgi:hypothetical protein
MIERLHKLAVLMLTIVVAFAIWLSFLRTSQ